MSNNKKLLKKILIEGEIIAESGILIGGTNSALEIGGVDKYVIRNPINDMPYIPGSSLKGKMRSLLELSEGTLSVSGKNNDVFGPTHDPNHIAAALYGHINKNKDKTQQASRVIVRDAELINSGEFEGKTDLLHTEIKAENTIDRITSKANPRFFERVPKGAKFKLNIVINVFSHDKFKDKFLSTIFESLKLVQDDYLGGGGSRGNGQIRFEISKVCSRSSKYYTGEAAAESLFDFVPKELQKKNRDEKDLQCN